MGHRLERHRDLGDLARQPLAGPEIDGDAGPAPVVDLEPERRVGLRGRVLGDAVLLEVASHRLALRHARRVLRPHGHVGHVLGLGGVNRVQHLDLLVADVVGREGHGRLHAEQRQQLEHVVLHEVAQGAGLVVVAGPRADADVLGRRDLDVVDEVAAPDRLEHAVREPERQHVLDGLLAQVVVDAEDLLLVEDRQHVAVQLERLGQVGADRLLDHDPDLRALVRVELVLAELGDDNGEEGGRGRQVEDPVERDPRLLVELGRLLLEVVVDVVVVEGARHVAQPLEQPVEHLLVRLAARELLDRVAGHVAVVVVRDVRAGDADQVEALGQRALVGEVVERGQQLAPRQVARAAEDRHRRRADRQPLQPGAEGVVLLLLVLFDDAHEACVSLARVS